MWPIPDGSNCNLILKDSFVRIIDDDHWIYIVQLLNINLWVNNLKKRQIIVNKRCSGRLKWPVPKIVNIIWDILSTKNKENNIILSQSKFEWNLS